METNNESPSNGTPPEKTKCCTGKTCGGEPGKRCCRRRHWIGAALVIGVIVAVVAFTSNCWRGQYGPHGYFGSKDATHVAEFVVDRIMNEVKADDAQKLKARGIADATAGDLKKLAVQHRENHKEFVAILSEPTLDRAKLEALRSKTARSLDESSKRISVAVADLADVLTPAQRQQLADRIERKRVFHISE